MKLRNMCNQCRLYFFNSVFRISVFRISFLLFYLVSQLYSQNRRLRFLFKILFCALKAFHTKYSCCRRRQHKVIHFASAKLVRFMLSVSTLALLTLSRNAKQGYQFKYLQPACRWCITCFYREKIFHDHCRHIGFLSA